MKILIDTGHPAHVHMFRNFAHIMESKGNEVIFTLRDKDCEINLLEKNGFKFYSFGNIYKTPLGKIWGIIKFTYFEWKICRKFKPDYLLSHGSICAAWASWLIRKPHITFDDSYYKKQILLYKFCTNVIFTGNYPHPIVSKKDEIRINGYNDLLYMHPNYYTIDKSIYNELGLSDGTPYCILRFIGWKAFHDVGHKGISLEKKKMAIKEFSKYCKVFISSETELPKELNSYLLKIEPDKMHDVLANAKMLFGESGTMAEEAAMVGVPSIIIYPTITHYTKHLEDDYGLLYNYVLNEENIDKAINKGIELLADKDTPNKWKQKRDIMLAQKIDVTQMLVWFVENYPESKRIMKENPDYQMRFK